jgi:hypothetical protein
MENENIRIAHQFTLNRRDATKRYGIAPYPQFDASEKYRSKGMQETLEMLWGVYKDANQLEIIARVYTIESLWYLTKRIFVIDPTVATELLNSKVSKKIDMSQVRLPDWGIAVSAGNLRFKAAKFRLHCDGYYKDRLVFWVHESETQLNRLFMYPADEVVDLSEFEDAQGDQILSVILYISAVKDTIPKASRSNNHAKQPKKIKHFDMPEHSTSVVLGAKLGERLRAGYTGTKLSNGMKAHIRRAHWHNYWTGPKDNRRLICKWTNSTGVNMNLADV